MKKLFLSVILVFSLALSTTYVSAYEPANELCDHTNGQCLHEESEQIAIESEKKVICQADLSDEFSSDELIVILNNSASIKLDDYDEDDFTEVGCIEVQDLTSSYISKLKEGNVTRSRSNLGVNVKTFNRILKLKIKNGNKSNILNAIKILEKRNDVLAVDPVYNDLEFCLSPNDDMFLFSPPITWGYDKIQLPDAWDITTGSYDVVVGVIDSGISISHQDLYTQVNTEMSKSFEDDTLSPTYDIVKHGSRIASIIGAKGGNGLGSAGVCWNVTMVSLKVDNQYGAINTASIISAINYANLMNIPIINLSIGWYGTESALYQAIQNYSGLIVCSAGNEDSDLDNIGNNHIPSNYNLPNLIAVGASTIDDSKSDSSNYGHQNVDIFAPGYNINCLGDNSDPLSFDCVSGTSYAAPFVTGVAALLLSEYDLTASELKQTIMMNVDDADDGVTAFTTLCASGGRLNAFKALTNPHFHSLTYSNITSTGHMESCMTCSYQSTVDHSFSGTFDSYTHQGVCSKCNYNITGEHNFEYVSYYDALTHQVVCEVCKYVKQREFHTWGYASDGVTLICTKCGMPNNPPENDED